MENKNLRLIIWLALITLGYAVSFMAGMKYQENKSEGFKLNIGDTIQIESSR